MLMYDLTSPPMNRLDSSVVGRRGKGKEGQGCFILVTNHGFVGVVPRVPTLLPIGVNLSLKALVSLVHSQV